MRHGPVLRSRLLQIAPCLALGVSLQAYGATTVQMWNSSLTQAEVVAAQKGWCDALLSISGAYASGGFSKAKAKAEAVIDQVYAYQYGPVAFKPTLASGAQTFRLTRAGALAYFIGGDPAFPSDQGFALKPWRSCEVINQLIHLNGGYATTMGNVRFVDASGKTTTVDKTWSFLKEPDGSIRIVLHHSSLPFEG